MRKKRTNDKMRKGWEKAFYFRQVLWVHSARDASHRMLVVSNESGKFELHTYDARTGFTRQMTNRRNGTIFGSISPDGNFIYYIDERQGSEHGHFFRIPFAGGEAVDITPDLPVYYSYNVSSSDNGDRVVFTASIGETSKVYLISLGQEKTQCVYSSSHVVSEAVISGDGQYTCIAELKETSHDMLVIDNTTGGITRSSIQNVWGTITPCLFSSDASNSRILCLTNIYGSYSPAFFHVSTGKMEKVNIGQPGDIFVLDWNQKNTMLTVCAVDQVEQKLFTYNISTERVRRIGPRYGSFDLFFGSVAHLADGSMLLKWQSFESPAMIIKLKAPLYTRTTYVYGTQSTFPDMQKDRDFQSEWCVSSDGTKVHTWVARPKGAKKKYPFIIDIHGGPHGIVNDEYLPRVRAWLDHGFGYCAVNYRGSISFGEDFERKIYRNPGHWEVEDVVATRNHLVKKGWTNPDSVVLFGWSWGGYVALLALGKYPALWKGAFAGTPITDCIMQYEDGSAFFKAFDRELFGGTPDEVLRRYVRSSPVTYVDSIQAPILIIYGKNDTRCPPRQIIHFKQVMEKAGKQLSVRSFSSGHVGGFADTKMRVYHFSLALKFALDITQKKTPRSNPRRTFKRRRR